MSSITVGQRVHINLDDSEYEDKNFVQEFNKKEGTVIEVVEDRGLGTLYAVNVPGIGVADFGDLDLSPVSI